MVRQSISFTTPNNEWLSAQVESKEYVSKSEVVNDLIRKARAQKDEIESIRVQLIKSEQSEIITQTREEILAEFKKELYQIGKL